MPRNINKSPVSGKSVQPQISAKLLEELIPGFVTKEQFDDIFQNFKKAFIERALSAEMSHHLGKVCITPAAGRVERQEFTR